MKKKLTAIAFSFIIIAALALPSFAKTEVGDSVIMGGMPFGVRYNTNEVTIDSFCDVNGEKSPASSAGMKKDDIILKINGEDMKEAVDVIGAIENCGGKVLSITCKRGEDEHTFDITPVKSTADGKYRIGIIIRDASAGIGTVTYIDPETHEFGGLGHGICDTESGELIDVVHGVVSDVVISGIKKGIPGTPGELQGQFTAERIGAVSKNTVSGVFGYIADEEKLSGKQVEIAGRDSVKDGDACILCTLDSGKVGEYDIEIDTDAKNEGSFNIKITDAELISKTGGIVQGMSGSPVIQNGKLIGAVTHVLINDPSQGYGIFIENMLAAAG